jgi:hypothetical protein
MSPTPTLNIYLFEGPIHFQAKPIAFIIRDVEVGAAIAAPIRTGAEISLSSMMRRL